MRVLANLSVVAVPVKDDTQSQSEKQNACIIMPGIQIDLAMTLSRYAD